MIQTQPTAEPATTTPAPDSPEQRRRVLVDIRALNATATLEFLNQFSTAELRDYLEHLRHARNKHVRLPGWVQRRSDALAQAARELRKAS